VSPDGIITTIVGNGTPGFSGDGGPATAAQLNRPHGVVVDSAGNLFIADSRNYRVRKVSPNGIITTVAGNGNKLFTEEGGRATAAGLRGPNDVTIDAAGNLFIADSATFTDAIDHLGFNERVVKVFGVAAPGLFNGRLFPVTFESLCNLTQQFIAKTAGPTSRRPALTHPALAATALCLRLREAEAAAARGDAQARARALQSYVAVVSAQSGKALSPDQGAVLIKLARTL
jgi:secreted PhoX family phosphatase